MEDWTGHVIVCGLHEEGLRAVEQLHLAGVRVVVVDDHPAPDGLTLINLSARTRVVAIARADGTFEYPPRRTPGWPPETPLTWSDRTRNCSACCAPTTWRRCQGTEPRTSALAGGHPAGRMGVVSQEQPQADRVAERALEESPQQQYVGARDLTHWPSAAGRLAVRLWQRATRWLAPHQALALTLLIGLVLVGLLTAVAAQVYDAVAEADGVAGLDQPALDMAMDIRSATSNRLVGAYTHLGDTPVLPAAATIIAVALAVWWRQWSPIVLTAVTGLGALTLTVVGKATVGRIRPPIADAVPPIEHSFSFPSGHSLNSMALAGIIAYLLVRWQRHRWARATTIIVATAYAVTIGLSRIYLGAHWLTDVLVAWALALTWLTVVITAHRLFLTSRRRAGGA